MNYIVQFRKDGRCVVSLFPFQVSSLRTPDRLPEASLSTSPVFSYYLSDLFNLMVHFAAISGPRNDFLPEEQGGAGVAPSNACGYMVASGRQEMRERDGDKNDPHR